MTLKDINNSFKQHIDLNGMLIITVRKKSTTDINILSKNSNKSS